MDKAMKMITTLGFFLASALLLSGASCAAKAGKGTAPVTITGTVHIVGNVPFTEMVIRSEAEDGGEGGGVDYVVGAEFRGALENRQNQRVTVRALVTLREERRADGKALPPRRELSAVTLVED